MDTPISVPQAPTLRASVREAIRGSQQDYTSGSINRAIVLLAIPMVLEMCMESLFAIVDVFWVGRLGADAVSTVGLTESMLMLVYAAAMGLGMSATAMVARRVGEKDPEGAAVAGVQSIALGMAFGLAMGLPCLLFAPNLLRLMGASPAITGLGSSYARIAMGGCCVVTLLILNNAVFRGAGDAAIAMRVLWLANGINLLLDPCLIFGIGPFPRMGVTGAATATLIGRSVGVLFQFYRLGKGGGHIRVLARHLGLNLKVMARLLKISLTGIAQMAIPHVAWIGMVRIVSMFGSAAIAGYTIGIRIVIFVILPSWGLSGAAATLVGQNLGAKRPERAEKSVWITGFYNMIFLGAVGVFLILFARPVVHLFTQDPEVAAMAVACLRILSFGNVAYAYGMVMLQAFNGAGDTRTPTIVNFFGYWVLEIPLAYALALTLHLGANGVYLAILISEAAIAAVCVALFRRGKWKGERI